MFSDYFHFVCTLKIKTFITIFPATLGAVAAGAVLGFTSPTEEEIKNGALGFKVSKDDMSWVASLTPLGCLVMCIPVGSILDLIGRKMTMLAVILVFTVGWLMIILANGVALLMAGRFLTGMAGGTFCVAAPLYTSEIAQKDIRGTLGSYFQLMITVGVLFVYVIGDFLKPRDVAIGCAVLPFIFGLAFVFMPESPIYNLKRGNKNKAMSSLQWLRGQNYDITNEINDMEKEIEDEKRNPISFMQSWKKKATKKAFLISFGLMFFQQFSGINAIIFFTSKIFKAAGAALDPKEASIIVGVMQVVATLTSTLVIDRLGRKILLLLSAGVMAICTMLLGIFFSLKSHHVNVEDIGWLPILSLSVFVIVFSLGFGPIPWMISAEIFPQEVKSVASSAAGTFNWFLAFLITMFFEAMVSGMGEDGAFYLFMVVCVIGFFFVFFIVLETKGKSLEQIQQELEGDIVARRTSIAGIDNQAFQANS